MVKVAVGDRTAAALSSLFSLSVSPSSVVRMKETQGKSSLCLLPPPTTPPTIPVPPPPVVSEPLPHPHISVFHPMTLAVRQIDTPSPIVSTLSCKFVTSSSFWGDGGGFSQLVLIWEWGVVKARQLLVRDAKEKDEGARREEALRVRSMRCSPAVHLPNLKRRSTNDFPTWFLWTDGGREERIHRESRKIRPLCSNAYRWEKVAQKISF